MYRGAPAAAAAAVFPVGCVSPVPRCAVMLGGVVARRWGLIFTTGQGGVGRGWSFHVGIAVLGLSLVNQGGRFVMQVLWSFGGSFGFRGGFRDG